jgi:hypothetical protein
MNTDNCALLHILVRGLPLHSRLLSIIFFKAPSAAVYGIDANLIDVEVDCSGAVTEKDIFHTVGLPDAAVRESRDPVRAAIKNSGYSMPATRPHHQPGACQHDEERRGL